MSKNKNKNKAQKKRKKNAPRETLTKPKSPPSPSDGLWLYGKHAVLAALENPTRKIKRLIVTKRSVEQCQEILTKIHQDQRALTPEIVPIDTLEKFVPKASVHQGIILQTAPLPAIQLEDCCKTSESDKNLILVMDQVTDPHNVGAIIRSAAAFGAKAIVTTDRHAPPESGPLAKSASGALEAVPWVRVTNLSRALDQLADMGYWRIGLDGYADQDIRDTNFGDNIVLVLGAEGKGIRKGTADHCDALVKLPISRTVESLNVSNAAAVALYEFSTK